MFSFYETSGAYIYCLDRCLDGGTVFKTWHCDLIFSILMYYLYIALGWNQKIVLPSQMLTKKRCISKQETTLFAPALL